MRRLLRRAFDLTAVVSAVLSVAALAAWHRSLHSADGWCRTRRDHCGNYAGSFDLASEEGWLTLHVFRTDAPVPAAEPIDTRVGHTGPQRVPAARATGGFVGAGWGRSRASIDLPAEGWIRDAGLWHAMEQDIAVGPVHRWVRHPGTAWALTVRYPLLAVIFAFLPAARAATRPRGRRRVGLWAACGYDLRATPDRCPECGACRLHG